jgi:hypothetical protein
MELVSPTGNRRFRLDTLRDKHNAPLDEVPGGGWEVLARLPEPAGPLALLTRLFD